ncbi:hypothetical protein B0J18DRAFT_168706 [Chaetomium sp. MPI-SDFR-AT-0129]|nr:hypothetical protein B0J18DRAFT_168706 [Chaetomium sp. MPI-SDFR-AT-0129]
MRFREAHSLIRAFHLVVTRVFMGPWSSCAAEMSRLPRLGITFTYRLLSNYLTRVSFFVSAHGSAFSGSLPRRIRHSIGWQCRVRSVAHSWSKGVVSPVVGL